MEKETLEEAAEKYYPPKTTDLICSPKLVRDAFAAGANYMAERMYSEEDMEKAFTNGLNRSFDSDFDRWLGHFKKK